MTPKEYEQLALITRGEIPDDLTLTMFTWAGGMDGELGEFSEIIKKWSAHGHAFDYAKAEKELGDVLWYVTMLIHDLGGSLERFAPFWMSSDSAGVRARANRTAWIENRDLGKVREAWETIFHANRLISDIQYGLMARNFYVGNPDDFRAHQSGLEFHSKSILDKLLRLLGFLGELSLMVGTTPLDVAQKNIEKLKARYPEGFSHAASIGRAD